MEIKDPSRRRPATITGDTGMAMASSLQPRKHCFSVGSLTAGLATPWKPGYVQLDQTLAMLRLYRPETNRFEGKIGYLPTAHPTGPRKEWLGKYSWTFELQLGAKVAHPHRASCRAVFWLGLFLSNLQPDVNRVSIATQFVKPSTSLFHPSPVAPGWQAWQGEDLPKEIYVQELGK